MKSGGANSFGIKMIKFQNDTPINSVPIVLDLMDKRWNDGTTRIISRWHKKFGDFIELGHHHDFSDSLIHRYSLADGLVDQMISDGFLTGTPQWGYTEMKSLRISSEGTRFWNEERNRMNLDPRLSAERWFEEAVRAKR